MKNLIVIFGFACLVVSCSVSRSGKSEGYTGGSAFGISSGITSMAASEATSGAGTALMNASYADSNESSSTEAPWDQDVVSTDNQFKIQHKIRANSLTAGSFDDSNYPRVFRTFIESIDAKLDQPLFEWGQRVLIHVRNQNGDPVGNANISIFNNSSSRLMLQTKTSSDGRAIFVVGWDKEESSQTLLSSPNGLHGTFTLQVQTGSGVKRQQMFSLNNSTWDIVVPDESKLPQKLDVAFVIDATGSMDDEIRYIQVEAASIASSIQKKFPYVDARFALIVYRDKSDAYIVKDMDFTSLQDFMHFLSHQSADGGGDLPEAMDKAIFAAQKLNWREGNVARLMFLIADAPSHDSDMKNTIEGMNNLRKKGIKIYPIAASGVESKAEYLMRIASFLTLGEYVFLTDDSGIGNPHAEPHIPFYFVQKLNVMITRFISSELAGRKYPLHRDQIIRTSGNPNFYDQ